MISNLQVIEPLLNFTDKGDFYFIQIIKRKRENDISKSERLIQSYFIYSTEDLYKKWDNITTDCELNNARAYFWINKRNDKKIAMETLLLITQNICNQNYNIKKCYLSSCGKHNSETNRKWIIDFDNNLKEKYTKQEIITYINTIPLHGDKDKLITEIETPNGIHLITHPFDSQKFREVFEIDVHKDNPTVLYYKEKQLTKRESDLLNNL